MLSPTLMVTALSDKLCKTITPSPTFNVLIEKPEHEQIFPTNLQSNFIQISIHIKRTEHGPILTFLAERRSYTAEKMDVLFRLVAFALKFLNIASLVFVIAS